MRLKPFFNAALIVAGACSCYIIGQKNYERSLMRDTFGNNNVLTITFDNVRMTAMPTMSMKDGAHQIIDEALEEFFIKKQILVENPSRGYTHEPKALRADCGVGACFMRR